MNNLNEIFPYDLEIVWSEEDCTPHISSNKRVDLDDDYFDYFSKEDLWFNYADVEKYLIPQSMDSLPVSDREILVEHQKLGWVEGQHYLDGIIRLRNWEEIDLYDFKHWVLIPRKIQYA